MVQQSVCRCRIKYLGCADTVYNRIIGVFSTNSGCAGAHPHLYIASPVHMMYYLVKERKKNPSISSHDVLFSQRKEKRRIITELTFGPKKLATSSGILPSFIIM
jgi:hypothetical protein